MDKNRPIQNIFFVIMRITLTQILLMAIFASLVSAADLKGQEILDREISVEAHDKKIKAILKDIEKQLSVIFTYRPDLIKVSEKVSVQLYDAPLREVLDQLFSPQVEFLVEGKEILLKPAALAASASPLLTSGVSQGVFEVSRTIVDETGQS